MKTADIERLIGFAYSGIEPPPAIEVALPGERVRPARRGRLALAALLAMAVVAAALARPRAAGDLADEGDPELAVVARPPTGVVLELGEDRARVRLTRDGRILVPAAGEEWRQVTLAELGPRLKRAAETFHDRETAAGRSGYEDLPGGGRASLLGIDLFADREAPWQHLQWIMVICAEQGVSRLAFEVSGGGGEFKLDAGLPVDRGLGEERHIKVTVRIRAAGPVRYAFGDQEAEELASVARYLAAAKKAAEGMPVRGEVKANRATPFHEVAKLLAEFRQAGYEHVDFYGTAIPGADVREAPVLPQPKTDWRTDKAMGEIEAEVVEETVVKPPVPAEEREGEPPSDDR